MVLVGSVPLFSVVRSFFVDEGVCVRAVNIVCLFSCRRCRCLPIIDAAVAAAAEGLERVLLSITGGGR
jgi:hypothetical protein